MPSNIIVPSLFHPQDLFLTIPYYDFLLFLSLSPYKEALGGQTSVLSVWIHSIQHSIYWNLHKEAVKFKLLNKSKAGSDSSAGKDLK